MASTVAAYPNPEISSSTFLPAIYAALTSVVAKDFVAGAFLVAILLVLCMVPA
jgi:hypothetical protein